MSVFQKHGGDLLRGGWALVLWLNFPLAFSPAHAASRVTVFDADGRTTTGELNAMTPGSVSIDVDVARSWKWSDLVSLRFDDRPAPSEPRGAAIWLANGDRLIATATGIEDERLKATWVRFAERPALSLPLESVRGLTLLLPQARDRRDELASWILDRREKRDEVRLLNDDLVSGELTDWKDGSLALSSGANKIKLPIKDVREIGFNADLLALPEPKELCWLVSLSDGSRVTLKAAACRIEREVLSATHVSGATWEIPLAAVCALRVLQGRAVYLSDLSAIESTHTPFLPGTRAWSLQRDRAVDGSPLRLGGREFPKGLGMHSRSSVTYELAGKYSSFTTTIGLDDTTSGNGTAACAVEVDGRRVFDFASLSRTNGPQRLPLIDLAGAKRLTLITDFGDFGDVQDRVNWCDATLLR